MDSSTIAVIAGGLLLIGWIIWFFKLPETLRQVMGTSGGGSQTDELDLEIDGMSCGHCVASVEEALGGVDGVDVREVEIGRARVCIRLGASRRDVERAVEGAGFSVRSGAA